MPTLTDSKLPTQEKLTLPNVALYIAALNAARKTFIATESTNKMKLDSPQWTF